MIGSQYVAQADLELPVIFLRAPPVHILDSSKLLAFVATSATYTTRGCNCVTCLSESEPRGTWAGGGKMSATREEAPRGRRRVFLTFSTRTSSIPPTPPRPSLVESLTPTTQAGEAVL